jgi:hypothetical protein
MPVILTCLSCGRRCRVRDDPQGRQLRCPECGAEINQGVSFEPTGPLTIRATAKITLGEGIAAPWIGLAGAAALLIGVFLPLIRLPIFGSVNYIFNGQGDGMIVAVLALVAACTSLARWYRSLWIAGLLERDRRQTGSLDDPRADLSDLWI